MNASEQQLLDSVDIFQGEAAHSTQAAFLSSNAPRKAYIGPFGSGKTKVLAWQAMVLSHWFVPNNGLIGRLSYPDLRDTTRKQFMDYVPKELYDPSGVSLPDKGDGYIEWKVGGATLFRNLDQPAKFGSLNLGYAGIDEMAEVSEGVFNAIEARVGRHWRVAALRPGVWPYSPLFGVGNPGGRDWIWRRFYKPGRSEADQRMYQGFQPKPKENEAFLPPGYYETLMLGKPEWWIRRFIKGDMRALEGLVWPVWDDTVNVVHPFPIPDSWRRVMGLDHGSRNPTAAQWWTVDLDGNLICYRDYEVAGPTIPEHARAFKRLENRNGPEEIEYRVADPAIFIKNQTGKGGGDKWHSIAEEYDEVGYVFQRGDNAMSATLARVNKMLWQDPRRRFPAWHPKAGRLGSPRMFFWNTCERSIEACSSWKFKEFKEAQLGLREEPVDVDDHLPDVTRYVSASFPDPSIESGVVREYTMAERRVERQKAHGRLVRQQLREIEAERDGGGNDDYA